MCRLERLMATVRPDSIATGRETAASFKPLSGDHRFYSTMAAKAYVWSVLLAFTAVPPVVAAMSATATWRSIAGWLLRG